MKHYYCPRCKCLVHADEECCPDCLYPVQEDVMKMKARDGKLYAELTLRDIVERCDVSDAPILAEIRRLYSENDKLREVAKCMTENLFYSCSECWAHGDASNCGNVNCGNHKTYKMLCELGIEV